MAEGNFILATFFFALYGITASTIGVYFILCEAEKIARAKKALQISSQFLHALQIANQNVKFYKESGHDKSGKYQIM